MKITPPRLAVWCLGIALIAFNSCKTGKPVRKTLPDQLYEKDMEEKFSNNLPGRNTENSSGPGDLPFYAVDTVIDGKSFTAIYLRDPAFDSIAFNIVQSYQPFASSLLQIIAAQGIKGVFIDFRKNAAGENRSANFRARENNMAGNQQENQGLEIRFSWNEGSDERVAGFIQALEQVPFLQVDDLQKKDQFSAGYKQNCFQTASPNFDQQ